MIHRSFIVVAVMALCGPVRAAPGDDAHRRAGQRFDEGLALADAGQLARALEAFKEAHALEPNPAVLYNIGQALRGLGRQQEAVEALERYLAEAGAGLDPARRRAVDQQLRDLRERLSRRPPEPQRAPATGQLEVRCLAAGTRVFADGRWLGEGPFEGSLTVTEGIHEVRFENPRRPVEVRSIQVAAGGRLSQTCAPPVPAPPAPTLLATTPPPRSRPTGAYATVAGGAAFLGGALAVHLWNDHRYGVWKSDRDQIDTSDPATLELQRASNERLTSIQRTDKVVWGLAAAGGLLLTIGATWWWAHH